MLQDVRYALRSLRHHPVFTLTAVLTLGLGIGANTAIFSAVNGVLLRPLPFAEPERLVTVWGHHPAIGRETASLPDFLDWRAQSRAFTGLAARANTQFTLAGAGEPEVVPGALVTANYFRVLGSAIPVGRGFRDEEEHRGSARVAVLSDGFWRRQFGGRPDVVGRQITLSGVPYTVIGAGARGLSVPQEVDVWATLLTDTTLGRRNDFLEVVGRLAPGTDLRGANEELTTIARRLEGEYPNSNAGWGVELVGLQERVVGEIRPALVLFMGAVGLVLLIACANVANLMLSRVAAREREVTIRAALGASRRRLVTQLLTESVLLALAGGVLGLGLAVWGVHALQALDAGTIPRLSEIGVGGAALAFALVLSVATGLLFGVVPAVRVLDYDLRAGLGEGGRGSAGHRAAGRTRSLLVLAEVALACVLLVGAALLLRSFAQLQRTDPGFLPGGVLTARVTLPRVSYSEEAKQTAFGNALLERLQALPGVSAAAIASDPPLGDNLPYWGFAIEGEAPPPADVVEDAAVYRVSPAYFGTFRIPLLQGRQFDAGDRAEALQVALVSETFARRYWPNRSPLGARITLGNPLDSTSTWMTIVGVVGDVRQEGPAAPAYPQLYLPLEQSPGRSIVIALRTAGDPGALTPGVKRAVASLDPGLALGRVATMDERLAGVMARPRVNAALLGGFAATALVLAALGIYGVIAYGVSQRTRELGIRMALGARSNDVLRLVLRQGLRPVVAGLALGLAAAAAGSRALRGLLYGVAATDLATYGVVAVFLAVVALVASYLPARRAATADPVTALRAE